LSVKDKESFSDFCNQHGLYIYLQPKGPERVYLHWPALKDRLRTSRLNAFNLEFKFHPLDFIQVNAEMNESLVSKVIELLSPKPNEHILDLFCGLGNFTLALAQFSNQVLGVEGSRVMADRALDNARHNGITNV